MFNSFSPEHRDQNNLNAFQFLHNHKRLASNIMDSDGIMNLSFCQWFVLVNLSWIPTINCYTVNYRSEIVYLFYVACPFPQISMWEESLCIKCQLQNGFFGNGSLSSLSIVSHSPSFTKPAVLSFCTFLKRGCIENVNDNCRVGNIEVANCV